MAFEPSDFEDLIRYLDEHPDVRDQLRRRILSDDFLRLPILVQELGEGLSGVQVRLDQVEARLDQTDTLLARIANVQQQTVEILGSLVDGQARTEASIALLIDAQARVEEAIARLSVDRGRNGA